MKGHLTSYAGLFEHVDAIEIPLIQRDYAQGREGADVQRIRKSFLGALHHAVTTGEPLHLDFVYGDLRDGTLRPLDGQQRLTTLFLLHWYLAYRARELDRAERIFVREDRSSAETRVARFGYAVRPTARLFCERLVECRPPPEIESVSAWLEDQRWHLHTWRHDPTIQGMQVMLDAMHARFRHDECESAWTRLVDPARPVITFQVLPIPEMGEGEDRYIKMNSRGKALTAFEAFKARFEKMIQESCGEERAKKLARAIDGLWSDVMWPYRGDDEIIDDELMRYLRFVTEACAWRSGRVLDGDLESMSEQVFGPEQADAAERLDYLFGAFEAWEGTDVRAAFESLLSTNADGERVVVFGLPDATGVDLFDLCGRTYGERAGKKRTFGLPLTVLLHAVLRHRMTSSPDARRRLRVLRNLIEASSDEIRRRRMPALMSDVEQIVVHGSLEGITALNRAQVEEERLKTALLEAHPGLEATLFALEDHDLLRGSLVAFDLDAATLPRRARTFARVMEPERWDALNGALLAQGDYTRNPGWNSFRLGTGSNTPRWPWRGVFTAANRLEQRALRAVLGALLDRVADAEDLDTALDTIRTEFLASTEESGLFDWRYYLVKYPVMRSGDSGLFASEHDQLGYRMAMLRRWRLNSKYRDPYLLAVHEESGVGGAVLDTWFSGYVAANRPRWMKLSRSAVALRCLDEGFALREPPDPDHAEAFDEVCAHRGVGSDRMLRIPQTSVDGRLVDTADRIQAGAEIVRALVDAGL